MEQQARQWLIRMDGDEPLTEAEQKALKEWMGRSSAHREELVRLSRFWSQANVLNELAAAAPTGEPARSRGMGRVWTALVAGAAVLGSILTVYLGLQPSNRAVTHSYETTIGQRKTIFLSDDGSSIQLNTDSRIDVTYNPRERRIRLSRGEAFFSVAPDARRVFEVHMADSVVRAIGTAFNVHLEGRTIELVVTKGSVEVSDAIDERMSSQRTSDQTTRRMSDLGRLEAGEAAFFVSGSERMRVQRLSEAELQRRLSWQDGYLAFSGEPLIDVVTQMNRYSAIKVSVGEASLESIPIGGDFKIGDVEGMLDLLHSTLGIQARWEGEHRVVLEPKRRD